MKNVILIPALLLAFASSFNTLTAQDSDNPSFTEFVAQFPTASLPYTIKTEDLQAQLESKTTAKAKRLDWQYYEYLPELERSAQFSNMPVYPEPVAAFETQEYVAVLYNIARGAGKGTKTYTISVFDCEGKHIATNFVAGANTKSLTAATINADFQANVQEYKVNWLNDILENGREGNSVKSLDPKVQQVIDLILPGNPDQIDWSVKTTNTEKNGIATK